MTIAYSINSGTEVHGVESTWERLAAGANVDGSIRLSSWAHNTWKVERMTVATYLELQTAQGTSLTSLQTNDIDANNTGKSYTSGVILFDLSNSGHIGVNMAGVEVVFKVKV